MLNKWKRNCPVCKKELTYTRRQTRDEAEQMNRACLKCACVGPNHGMKGKHHKNKTLKLMSSSHIGQNSWNKGRNGIYSKETLEKMRNAKIGKPLSENHRQKLRETTIAYLQKSKNRTSKSATRFLDELEKIWNAKI